MERTLSQEERQRRAEELYYKRQNLVNSARTTTVNITPKKNYKLLKKVIIQIIICVGIYSVIYKLQSNSDNFSIDSINYLRGAIEYDINMNKTFEDMKKYMSTFNLTENNIQENNIVENVVTEKTEVEGEIQEATLSVSEQAVEEVVIRIGRRGKQC